MNDLTGMIYNYDPHLGNVGRGFMPKSVEEIILIVRDLTALGFVQYATPGLSGAPAMYLPLYTDSGVPAAGVWFGFVREIDGQHEMASFECSYEMSTDYSRRTGRTLADAIASATRTGTKAYWSQCPAVESVPDRRSGAWVFRGTRMPVSTVFECLALGTGIDEIMEQYFVTREQIQDVLRFVADSLRQP